MVSPVFSSLRVQTGLGDVFKVDLVWQMPVPGGHDARENCRRRTGPISGAVALAIALIFQLDIMRKGPGRSEFVDDHRMVDDEIDGHERVDPGRIATELGVMPSRMAARSTTAGTPVKSCISTRAGAIGDPRVPAEPLVFEPGGRRRRYHPW